MQRKRKRPLSGFSLQDQEHSQKSAMIFRGRFLLKEFYYKYHLYTSTEHQQGIDILDQQLLALIPDFVDRGLDAAAEHLKFTPVGISVGLNEAGYSHQSREKLAILYFIIQFELKKEIQISPLVKDELMCIKRMSELVDWISNLKSEKDVQRILESKHPILLQPDPLPLQEAVPYEKLLTIKELAAALDISEKTIRRNPQQFKAHRMGVRNYYYLSECKPKYK